MGSRCLVCYTTCLKPKLPKRKLPAQLQTIFILRTLFKLPEKTLSTYLVTEGSPEEWIALCSACTTSVEMARKVYEDLLEITRKFELVRKELTEAVKTSCNVYKGGGVTESRSRNMRKGRLSLTDECRLYISLSKHLLYILTLF